MNKARLATNERATAPMEICALNRRSRAVNSVMPTAEASGSNRITQATFAKFMARLPPRVGIKDLECGDLSPLFPPGRLVAQENQRGIDRCSLIVQVHPLELQRSQILHVRGLAFAVKRHDQ